MYIMSFKICRKLSQCSSIKFRKILNSVGSYSIRRSNEQRYFSTAKLDNISELIDCSPQYDEFTFEDSFYVDLDEKAITDGDPEKLKILRALQVKLNIMKQDGKKIPSKLTVSAWRILLTLNEDQRTTYLGNQWYIETMKDLAEHQKLENKEKLEQWRQNMQKINRSKARTSLKYGLSDISLFHNVRNKQINRFYEYKLLFASWFGPHILVDCGYESLMSAKCLNVCVKHLLFMWGENRKHPHPFNIIFCNVDLNGLLIQRLKRKMNRFNINYLPLDIRAENYVDIFPKEKLVYLTADCTETLMQYNPEDIYIIGGLVDSSRCETLSIERAEREGIRKAKLPFVYLSLTGKGGKQPTLLMKDVLAIMAAAKCGIGWSQTLNYFVSKRPQQFQLPDDDSDEDFDKLQDNDSD